MDAQTVEKYIIKAMLLDKNYSAIVSATFVPDYFENKNASEIFQLTKDYLLKYNNLPSPDIIIKASEDNEETKLYFDEVNAFDFDIATHYDYLLDETNIYLKDKAIKGAILSSVDIIKDGKDLIKIRKLVEEALCKDIRIDLGLNYFNDLSERLKRMLTSSTVRVPTYFPCFDEYISGGFPPYTLSVILGRIHFGKSSILANFAARQVLKGHDVALFTMEMSEDAFAQRFDAIYSKLDINKIYTVNNYTSRMMSALEKTKAIEKRGNLIIKQFPTGKATVNDLRMFLRELSLRGINPAIVYIDYINLMRSTGISGKDSNLYEKIKDIAEELRSLSFEFVCPMVSVSQLNREGSSVDFDAVDFTHTAESLSLPATVDFMAIGGLDSERAVYTSELQYKIVKNRLGGRVGESNKLYNDNKTLKLYDSSELDVWIDDAKITEGDRSLAEVVVREQSTGRRSSGSRRR